MAADAAEELTREEVVKVEFEALSLAGKLMEEVGVVLERHVASVEPAVLLTAIQNLGVLLLGASGGSALASLVRTPGTTVEDGQDMLHKLGRYHADKAGRILASLVPLFLERWDELAAMDEREFADELGRSGMYIAVNRETGETFRGDAQDTGVRH